MRELCGSVSLESLDWGGVAPRHLAHAKAVLRQFAAVLITEELDDAAPVLRVVLGWSQAPPSIAHLNAAKPAAGGGGGVDTSKGRVGAVALRPLGEEPEFAQDPAALVRLAERNSYDLDLYTHAVSLWRAQLRWAREAETQMRAS